MVLQHSDVLMQSLDVTNGLAALCCLDVAVAGVDGIGKVKHDCEVDCCSQR